MKDHAPTAFVIIGGAGDLAQRKLFPALFNLFKQGSLPQQFIVVGLARTERKDFEFQSLIAQALETHTDKADKEIVNRFCSHLRYVSGSYEEIKSYKLLKNVFSTFEKEVPKKVNRLFYLAVPPTNYQTIFTLLHESSLAQEQDSLCWARILVEKPFGNNYETAVHLEKILSSYFKEEQIFRIDHYLAKEAIMNILSFRFANSLFESAWDNNHIQEVFIHMYETRNVDARGSFYDTIGALRDVGQNHLLQILALIAMEEPQAFDADAIRQRRQEILEHIVPYTKETITESTRRAQYDKYKQTKGVQENSTTETYFEFTAYLNHKNWVGVPFKISAGKALSHDEVSVEIKFHDVKSGPFEPSDKNTTGNRIMLTISPVQSMNVVLNVKKQGHGFDLETNTLSFAWDEDVEHGYTAYEKILLDAIQGDQTLFTKTGEVLASWKFITSILDSWEIVPLDTYQQGSQAPLQLPQKGV